ncbi:MAG: trypsin-like serine protease [Nannocystaceae bacterium]|nr:trypsin-like serine protease [Nannocystaceae bacterium]
MVIAAFAVLAVAGAAPAAACQWPSVATFRVGETKCSATLVHPQVIVTAAHCLEAGDTARVRFGEDFSPYEVRIDVASCFVNETYFETRSPHDDFAACVLVEPVQIPIVPIAMGCDTAALVPGAEAAIVGFGLPGSGQQFGRKHWARTVLAQDSRPDGLVAVGDAVVNGCLGDSGGPGFVRLPDGTWRTFGILVAGPDCGDGASTYALLHDRVAWLEDQSGFDLTPCHDADGVWNPGPDCLELASSPAEAIGSWDEHCARENVTRTGPCPEGLAGSEEDGGAATSTGPTDPADADGEEPRRSGADGCSIGTSPAPVSGWLFVIVIALRRGQRHRRGPGDDA